MQEFFRQFLQLHVQPSKILVNTVKLRAAKSIVPPCLCIVNQIPSNGTLIITLCSKIWTRLEIRYCIFLAFFVVVEYNSFQWHKDSTRFDSIFAEHSHAEGVVRYGNLSGRANRFRAKASRRRVRLGLECRAPDHQ